MPNPLTLPKDLPVNVVFIRMRFKFTHKMFDESFQGHLGHVSQFILKEMRRGTPIEAIKGAFPFNIQPVIEHLHQSLLLEEGALTDLGCHYGYCLDSIHDSEFYGWVHWGSEIKILLPDDFHGFLDVSQESASTYQVRPNFKGEYPFAALTEQKKIIGLLSFLCEEYDTLDPQHKEKDVWLIHVAPAHIQPGEKEIKQCALVIPAQTMCAERGIPVCMPLMERVCVCEPVGPWEGYFPFALP